MANIRFILFDENSRNILPVILKDYSFTDMYIWGSAVLGRVLEVIYKNDFTAGAELFMWDEVGNLIESLVSDSVTSTILVSRVSNPVILKSPELFGIEIAGDEIVKLRVNGVPSDFYVLRRELLIDILKVEGSRLAKTGDLFDTVLFNNFTRIYDIAGDSHLMRNTREFFNENRSVVRYLKDKKFMSVIARVPPVSDSESFIGEEGEVVNSYIGGGSIIHGRVIGSTIFSNVNVGRGSIVQGSVILPGNRIGENCIIKNSLILKGNNRIIENDVKIGLDLKEETRFDRPGLNTGMDETSEDQKTITVIGEDILIPEGSTIGRGTVVNGTVDPSERIITSGGETISFVEDR